MKIDMRGIETIDLSMEIINIQEHLEITLKGLEEMQNLRRKEFKKELDTSYGNIKELDEGDYCSYCQIRDYYKYIVESDIPRMVLGSYIIALWSVVETIYERLAIFYQMVFNKTDSMDTRGNFPEQVKRYFKRELNKEYKPDDFEWTNITDFYALRNAFAHKNGRYEYFTEKKRNEAERLISMKCITLCEEERNIIPKVEYIKTITKKLCELMEFNIDTFNDIEHEPVWKLEKEFQEK